ncbi:MAG: DUF4258 domain-containing protein [Bacteroidia bacterium]
MADKKRKQLYSAILLGILLLVYVLFFRKETDTDSSRRPARPKTTRKQVDHREADFRHNRIYYTKHGRCRMDCRHIDESEVKEILRDGTINYAKSNLHDKPCPTYAVEGTTHDGQHVRIVVGDCSSQASIVTVIDLENDFECECN